MSSNELVQTNFDYSLLSEEQASQLQDIYNRVLLRHVKTTYEDGRDLVKAQSIQGLPYAQFIDWANKSFGWSEHTVVNKKNAYHRWGDFTAPGAVIEDHAVYLLSTKRVPESAREEAKALLTSGTSIDEEKAKEIRDAHIAREKAEKEAESTQQELFSAQDTIASLEDTIASLNADIDKLQEQEVQIQEVEKIVEVVPDEVQAQLDERRKLLVRIAELEEQKRNLAKERDELSKDLSNEEARLEQAARDQSVRVAWRGATDTIRRQVKVFYSQFPSVVDTQEVFEPEDWLRLDEVIQAFQMGIEACRQIRNMPTQMIIDAR